MSSPAKYNSDIISDLFEILNWVLGLFSNSKNFLRMENNESSKKCVVSISNLTKYIQKLFINQQVFQIFFQTFTRLFSNSQNLWKMEYNASCIYRISSSAKYNSDIISEFYEIFKGYQNYFLITKLFQNVDQTNENSNKICRKNFKSLKMHPKTIV